MPRMTSFDHDLILESVDYLQIGSEARINHNNIIIIISFNVSTASIIFTDISSQNNPDTIGTSKANIKLIQTCPKLRLINTNIF